MAHGLAGRVEAYHELYFGPEVFICQKVVRAGICLQHEQKAKYFVFCPNCPTLFYKLVSIE